MQRTSISWADYSSNPLYVVGKETGRRGWYCTRVSEGCRNCYASRLNERLGTGHDYSAQNRDKVEWRLNAREFEAWRRRKLPSRIFVCVASETRVTMADGRSRVIASIRPGDVVLGYRQGSFVPSVVTAVHRPPPQVAFTVRAEQRMVRASQSHQFATPTGYVPLVDLHGEDMVGIIDVDARQTRPAISLSHEVGEQEEPMLAGAGRADPIRISLSSWNHRWRGDNLFSENAEGLLPSDSRNNQHRPVADRTSPQVLLANRRVSAECTASTIPSSQSDRIRDRACVGGIGLLSHRQTITGSPGAELHCTPPGAALEVPTQRRDAGDLPRGKSIELTWARIDSIEAGGSPEVLFDLTTSTGNFIANGFLTHNCDMTDWCHEDIPEILVVEMLSAMALSPHHTYLLLTKRPFRMKAYIDAWLDGDKPFLDCLWLGVSVEDQATADERIPLLLETPAVRRFVSYEPVLGPVDFRPWVTVNSGGRYGRLYPRDAVNWIIVGGESGSGARQPDSILGWVRDVRLLCQETRTAFWGKQAAGLRPGIPLPGELGDREWPDG